MERKGSEAGYLERWEDGKPCLEIGRRMSRLRSVKDSAISELWLSA